MEASLRGILAAGGSVGSGFAPSSWCMAALPQLQPAIEIVPPSAVEASLVRAFASFTEAAASLERSYSELQTEVARLRPALDQTNRDLAASLEENHRVRQHLKSILEGLPCGVLVTEADGSVSIANPEARRLLASPADESLASPARRLLERAHADSGEVETGSRPGESQWVTIRRAQIGEDAGKTSIFILQDISRLKRLQQEHEILRRRQALAEMSTVLAHEIRNPLGSLELFAGLLAESNLAAEERTWVEQLQAGLRTMAATVNNVLQFHSQPQPRFAPVDLGQLLRWLEQFLRPLAQRAGVSIQLASALDGVRIEADRHRVEQVMLNLALNSFHFMPAGGVLRITGEMVPGAAAKVRLEIADSGPGIAPEILHRIFEPGFTTRSGSPGLGLAVCQTIMEQHHGTIQVASRLGGAIFTLEFPRTGA
jgi:two-component system, sensor histidine kinase FlrB